MQVTKIAVALFLSSFFVVGIMGNVAIGQGSMTIGAVQTTKGALGAFGPEISAGLNDALMIANNEGGINGKKLTYVMADGNYNAQEDILLSEKYLLRTSPAGNVWQQHRAEQDVGPGHHESL